MAPRPVGVPPLAIHLIPFGASHTYEASLDSPSHGCCTKFYQQSFSEEVGSEVEIARNEQLPSDALNIHTRGNLESGSSSGWGSDAGDETMSKSASYSDMQKAIQRIEALRAPSLGGPSLEGDYKFRTLDGHYENFLRLQESGKWWHSAHRSQPPLHDVAVADHVEQGGESWEMAESLGTWHKVRLRRGESNMAVLLTFHNCRWASDFNTKLSPKLRPLESQREELGDLASEELVCFHDFTYDAAHRTPLWVRSTRAAVEMLGFRMMYGKGDPVNALAEAQADEQVLQALPSAMDVEKTLCHMQ